MPRSGLACSRLVPVVAVALVVALPARSEAQLKKISRDPYVGAIVLDAASGRTLFEDRAEAQGYPASVLKLMNLLIILEKLESKALKLSDPVTVTAEASRIGGSQVYLKEKEVFPVEDLLYALMVQSANDVATALAIHIAGSKDAFVELMNRRAQELGMKSTKFHSVHGLPPGKGQEPDVTTPRDLALLCVELLKHPEALKYTSTRERPFRTNAKEPFIMRTHNGLLGSVEGCDGLKTGFFSAAGYSIAATAKRGDKRVLTIILGSPTKKGRDAKARELIAKGFSDLAAPPAGR